MAAGGNFVAPLFRQGIAGQQDGGPVDELPTYHPPQELGADARYPLALVSPKAHAFLNSQYGNMDKQLQQQGPQRCLLHPTDAAARSIRDGDPVRVFNDRASIAAVARVTDQVGAGVVAVPMGHWPVQLRRRPGSERPQLDPLRRHRPGTDLLRHRRPGPEGHRPDDDLTGLTLLAPAEGTEAPEDQPRPVGSAALAGS